VLQLLKQAETAQARFAGAKSAPRFPELQRAVLCFSLMQWLKHAETAEARFAGAKSALGFSALSLASSALQHAVAIQQAAARGRGGSMR
jgi:hypothetical protein